MSISCLYTKKEMMELKKVQRGTSEMIKETEQGLLATERKRLKRDVFRVYRLVKVVDSVNAGCYS